jgi:carbonic anhydrase
MEPRRINRIFLCAAGVVFALSAGAEESHWGYGADDGPAAWSKLSAANALCAAGEAQSPIELRAEEVSKPAEAVDFDYQPSSLRIARNTYVAEALDNGHTIQIDVVEDSDLVIGKNRYQLLQYHFHAPSEHAVEGKRFPMEAHLVHRSASGDIAVVGILIVEGKANPAFERIWEHLPAEHGERVHHENVEVDVTDVLPKDHHWYRYEGSLTTPPCSEGVSWFVIANPIELSQEQIAAFTSLYAGNARPLQARHKRVVVYEEFE